MTAQDGKPIHIDGGVHFIPNGTRFATVGRVTALDEERQVVTVRGNGFVIDVGVGAIISADSYDGFNDYAMRADVEKVDVGGSGIKL